MPPEAARRQRNAAYLIQGNRNHGSVIAHHVTTNVADTHRIYELLNRVELESQEHRKTAVPGQCQHEEAYALADS